MSRPATPPFERPPQARRPAATLVSGRVGVWVGVWVVAGVTTACAPTLDWRESRLDGPGLVALFPCRPVAQSRQLSLAGAAVTMTLQACEAGDRTFAVATVDAGDPQAVDAALRALRDASLSKLAGGQPLPPPAPISVSGMTPQPAAGRWLLSRPLPDGGSIHLDMAVFARGTWVVQASVLGRRAGGEAAGTFFEGLRFAS